jgi:endogenous inhibitor of DNA gyrase (YacG/DUF329 family)
MSVACPHCGKPIIDDPAQAGMLVACPHCNQPLQMPGIAKARSNARKPSGLYGRFNILHYLLAGVAGLFIGGCGGCIFGSAMVVGAANDPEMNRVGGIGGALIVFGPLFGASLAIFILRAYDINRPKRGR